MSPNQAVTTKDNKEIKKREQKVVYKQVNYLNMLNKIIDNQYVDDKLSHFLNILES